MTLAWSVLESQLCEDGACGSTSTWFSSSTHQLRTVLPSASAYDKFDEQYGRAVCRRRRRRQREVDGNESWVACITATSVHCSPEQVREWYASSTTYDTVRRRFWNSLQGFLAVVLGIYRRKASIKHRGKGQNENSGAGSDTVSRLLLLLAIAAVAIAMAVVVKVGSKELHYRARPIFAMRNSNGDCIRMGVRQATR